MMMMRILHYIVDQMCVVIDTQRVYGVVEVMGLWLLLMMMMLGLVTGRWGSAAGLSRPMSWGGGGMGF